VGQGLVSLSGQVAEADQITMATDVISAIDGVVAVRNELTASTRH
jgi:osmotically-inducible protein OsmY